MRVTPRSRPPEGRVAGHVRWPRNRKHVEDDADNCRWRIGLELLDTARLLPTSICRGGVLRLWWGDP
jgi:hypothetical protein